MRKEQLLMFPFVACLVCFFTTQGPASGDFPPRPRPLPVLEDDGVRFSSPEFERLLNQLKSDRMALDSDWRSFSKQRTASRPPNKDEQQELQLLLKQTLQRLQLQQERKKPVQVPTPPVELPKKIPDLLKYEPALKGEPPVEPKSDVAASESGLPGRIDPLFLGNALFRAEKYEDALTSFRLIDLKAKKAEERAPIQFLMASCMLHLGKHEEAAEFLRDAANSRGDERFAGYAQWQLEMQRWQREIHNQLEDLRRRRLNLEKRP